LVVQELGWDEDVDNEVRGMIEDSIDGELIEEAAQAVALEHAINDQCASLRVIHSLTIGEPIVRNA